MTYKKFRKKWKSDEWFEKGHLISLGNWHKWVKYKYGNYLDDFKCR